MTKAISPPTGEPRRAFGALLADPGALLMRGIVEPFLSAMVAARRDSFVAQAGNITGADRPSGRLSS